MSASMEALEVGSAILKAMGDHRDKVLTTTYDSGKEFAHHKHIVELLGADAYFAHPHHWWERGTNENTNGLIRQYLPKGRDMISVTHDDCDRIARILNTRPRKRHNYRTPEEIINESCNGALQS